MIRQQDEPILTSAIAVVEILGALYRKAQAGELGLGGAEQVLKAIETHCQGGRIITAAYGPDVLAEAKRLVRLAFSGRKRVMIRTLDLLHVATATASKATALVATDARMRDLAALTPLKLLP
jgi:predicted nucleic acid-binding protein